MASITPIRTPEPEKPTALHDRAMDNLVFIRKTMESSGRFTALSGLGVILLGLTGLIGAWVAGAQDADASWLTTWLASAAVAVPLAAWAGFRKASKTGTQLFEGVGRRFVLGFVPSLLAGALLTAVLYGHGLVDVLPGMWLLLYGVGVLTAGAFSERILPLMGLSFMAVGTAALFSPAGWGNAYMAFGFGGLHLVFGAIITRRYGG